MIIQMEAPYKQMVKDQQFKDCKNITKLEHQLDFCDYGRKFLFPSININKEIKTKLGITLFITEKTFE